MYAFNKSPSKLGRGDDTLERDSGGERSPVALIAVEIEQQALAVTVGDERTLKCLAVIAVVCRF
jgi:hypothetical protein